MSEPKKKKKNGEPQLLFAKNKNVVSGLSRKLAHKNRIASELASRHSISPYFKLDPQKKSYSTIVYLLLLGMVFLPVFILSSLVSIMFATTGIYDVVINWEITFENLYSIIILAPILIVFSLLGLMWLRIMLNYRPKKARQLYNILINDGKVIKGIVTEGEIPGRLRNRIKYQFSDENEDIIKSTSTVPYMTLPPKGTPIYILYADKKLHTPL